MIRFVGHVGYHVEEAHRGARYAARSIRLLRRFARQLGIGRLRITCNPDNTASRRSCELAGARYVDTRAVPPGNILYELGERLMCIYELPTS